MSNIPPVRESLPPSPTVLATPPKKNMGCGILAAVGCGGFITLGIIGSLLPKPSKPIPTPTPQPRKLTDAEIKQKKADDLRFAEQEKKRLAKEAARKKAQAKEEERQRKAQEQEEERQRKAAEKKAASEWDQNGLVLLVNTIKNKTGEYGNLSITGIVENRTGRTLSYAQIQFTLYDKSGAQVGTALSNTNNLEPNGRWRFDAGILQDDAVRYKPSGLSGF